MKKIINLLGMAALLLAFNSCDKVDSLPVYGAGTAPALTASAATLAPAPADSNKVVLVMSWTYPNHATDSTNIKYTVELDSAGKNFSNPMTRVVTDSLHTNFIAKDINNFLLGRGYAFNVPVKMELRVISSYKNNNERLTSNTVAVTYTPYKVPPKVPLPVTGRLFMVGDASQGGWNNPVPVPTQEFARLNETTWSGVFNMNGGNYYLVLPENGSWATKFSVGNNQVPGLSAGGDFGFNLNDNFPAPATSGWYRVTLDFQTGKFSVKPFTSTMPSNLFIVGDATTGGWNNPVPVPSQQFTRLNASQFQLTLPLDAGKFYLLLPVNGDWGNKYAVANNSLPGLSNGGEFGYNLGDNFPGPAVAGNYKILVDFAPLVTPQNPYPTGKFTVTKVP